MLGEHDKTKNLKQIDFMIAGATSGAITRGLCQPLDVLKIRFQLQAEPIAATSSSKYTSILQATSLIFTEEGAKAFWKGHVPAQLLSIVYGSVQFWCYEIFMKSIQPVSDDHYKPLIHFVGGGIAGSVATVTSFPFDVVRTRLVGQTEKNRIYRGVFHAFTHIYKYEGYKTYFRGLTPTIIQVAPHSGAQFMFYKLFDSSYKYLFDLQQDKYSVSGSLVSGSLSGLCSKAVIYPFDLVRKRLQIQGVQKYRTEFGKSYYYNGMVDAFVKIVRFEGIAGLFKGLTPSLLKAVFTTALHFSTYEFVCQCLEKLRSDKNNN